MATNTLILHGPRDLRLQSRPIPPPPTHHVQIAITATGLCGSDLHYYTHFRNGAFAVQAPMALGHESAGVITAVGPGVVDLKVGDRVAVEAGFPCRACDYCSAGRYNLCKDMRFRSSAKTFPHLDGTMQGAINHPAEMAYLLPDGVSDERGALAEPLSVLLHASRRAGLQGGKVLIFGAGAIGLIAASLAQAKGVLVDNITMVDINAERLAFAKSHGLVGTVHAIPLSFSKGVDALEESRERAKMFGEESDVVYECTGAEACIQMAVFSAKTGGKVMLIGMGAQNALVPISSAATREVDVLGSFRYADTYKEALELLKGDRLIAIDALVTHRVPLEEDAVKGAFESMVKGKDAQGRLVIKVIVG